MKAKLFLALATVGSMLMFSACSNEEMPSGIATQEVRVTMSATIDQPADNLSRNELTEVAPGNINFYWTKGDAVVAVTEGGTVAGVLVAQEGGVASSELSGSLTLKDGDYNLTYYFLGNGVAVPEVGTAFDYTHSIANQSGDASEMKNHGIMATSGSVSISGGVATAQEIMLNHLMTFAHFEMVLAESMKGSSYEVTVSGVNVNNTVAVANGAITASNDETGCIKVGNALDFYMTVAPAKQMAFTFTVKVDGDKEYTASLPAVDIAASKFLRADFEEGIPVRFEEPVAPVDPATLNPLYKWATTNLDLSQTSGFATELYDRGQLFQFGRNKGFDSYTDAINSYAIYVKQSTTAPSSVWGFNVYLGTSTARTVDSYGHWYCPSDLTSGSSKNYFLIDDSDCDGSSTDYWPAREDYSDDWATRAALQGWEGDPSPEGWRIATSADYAEIMPSATISATTSANFINALSAGEIRTSGDVTYAIRWNIVYKTVNSVKRYVLLVQAIVVEEGTTLSQVNWDSDDVQARFFPCAGYIIPDYRKVQVFYSTTYGYNFNGYGSSIGYQRISRPLPVGAAQVAMNSNSSSLWLYYTSIEDYSNFRTTYWTADGKNILICYDLDRQYSVPYTLDCNADLNKMYAMPVRCVRK